MKYWTLLTLRVLARVGLLCALLLWCMPDSSRLLAGFSIGQRTVGLVIHERGWRTFVGKHITGQSTWWLQREEIMDPETRAWLYAMPESSQVVPGFYWDLRDNSYLNILVSHWLICLTFLIATIATSVRWRKERAGHAATE